jgi:hypothetical protein
MKTQQTGSEVPPGKGDDTLALIIKCPACDAQRAFRINNAAMLTLTRQSSGCEYTTECEICGHIVTIQLIWTRRHLGWVAEKIVFTKGVTVEDDLKMTKSEGRKQI